jgi:hypothetical protein
MFPSKQVTGFVRRSKYSLPQMKPRAYFAKSNLFWCILEIWETGEENGHDG